MSVKFTSHLKDFLGLYDDAVNRACETIGLVAEGHAKSYCTVDTGRLRASINHATVSGGGDDGYKDDKGNAFSGRSAHALPQKGECYIGTNVDYAVYQEFGTSRTAAAFHGRGYLRPAVKDHIDEYKKITTDELGKI